MLHLRVHGQGEVIRVLLVSLELGRPNLPSFLQVPREREGDSFHVKTEIEGGTPIRVKQKGCLDPREAFPTRLADRGSVGEDPHVDLAIPRARVWGGRLQGEKLCSFYG